ncbi:MAG: AMP-binding protein [Kutzneria sp.]|nr:AMP-binding protein [Kutzneria sp.]
MSTSKIEDVLPLTPLQQGMLFHSELSQGEEDVYTVQLEVVLDGPLRAEDLWAAAAALLERHTTLRVAFRRRRNGDPVQVVMSEVRLPRREVDLSDRPGDAAEVAAADRAEPFDLTRPPALRLTLLRLGQERHTLLVTSHHILLDGWSMPLLVRELTALHAVYADGGAPSAADAVRRAGLPPVTPYRDYLRWLGSLDDDAAATLWTEELAGLDEPTYLVPIEHGQPRPVHLRTTLPFGARLKATAREHGLTVNTVLQVAWAVVLGRLTRRDDVAFGATVSVRPPELAGADRMLGLFINTLPVRVRLREDASLLDTAIALQRRWVVLREHGHFGLSELRRVTGVGEVFDTLVVFQNFPTAGDGDQSTGDVKVIDVTGHDATHYPVSLVVDASDEITLQLTRRDGAIVPGGPDELLARVSRVLEAFADDPRRTLGGLDLLSPAERDLLLGEWIHTGLGRSPVAPGSLPPIGRPIPNARAYVLGPGLHLMPPGVTGEVYLAGVGIARGYLGQPALTAERFLPDPFGEPGSRMYRTGDLGRWRGDGQIEYLGRVDHQVKINGFRVEPAEVEAQLIARADVRRAVVVVREDVPGVRSLVAYVVAAPGARASTADLLAGLRERLPNYLVPDAVVWLDTIPTNAHDKVDRAALPAPEHQRRAPTAGPRTDAERRVLALVSEILGRADVAVEDNLFALGCDSLAAARLVSRIRTDTGHTVGVRTLYATPTVAGLAAALDGAGSGARAPSGLEVLLPLASGGEGPPVFCVHPGSGLGWAYAALTRWVDDRPVYALQARSLTQPDEAATSVDAMAGHYLDVVREIQPDGPYHLVGWSFGGVVAHAMAARLATENRSVRLLAVLDSFPIRRWTTLSDDDIRRGALDGLGLPADAVADGDLTVELVVAAARRIGNVLADLDHATVSALIRTAVHHVHLMDAHRAPHVSGDLLAFEATVRTSPLPDLSAEWAPLVGGTVDVRQVAVRHEDMLGPEALAVIGPELRRRLRG